MFTLVLGGARSGKSRYAQSLCQDAQLVVYLATARIEDEEMRARIVRHQSDRPAHWITVEEPLRLAGVLRAWHGRAEIVLIDCLTVWLSNWMWELRELSREALEAAIGEQIEALAEAAGEAEVVAVSNEVGSGIVPQSPAGRHFRDLQGWVNQRLAARADRVFLVVAGIPVPIKTKTNEGRT